MRKKYVSLGKPIIIREFEEQEKPMGWLRLDYLLKDKDKLKLLTKTELRKLKRVNK